MIRGVIKYITESIEVLFRGSTEKKIVKVIIKSIEIVLRGLRAIVIALTLFIMFSGIPLQPDPVDDEFFCRLESLRTFTFKSCDDATDYKVKRPH
jgi:hypothetical protein